MAAGDNNLEGLESGLREKGQSRGRRDQTPP
jgi:hypothetical protein